jgi:ABC-type methionine transport system permease subunit
MSETKSNNKAWYLAPIFLGIIGGLIMYLILKDENPKMAKKGLILSIVISVVSILAYIILMIILVTVSSIT